MNDNRGPAVALVTGSSRGIGFETARQLGALGIRVYVTARQFYDAEVAAATIAAAGFDSVPIALDITDIDSIAQCELAIREREGRLDILVNNAAIRIEQYGKSPSQQPMSSWRETFEINLFGTVELTRVLLPLVKAAPSGRIVNVSSLLGSLTMHSDETSYTFTDWFKSLPAYSAAKSAINSWTVHLAYELSGTRIKVNSVHPGYSRTDMNDGDGMISAEEGARTSVALATIPDAGPTGKFYHFEDEIPW